MDCVSYFIGEGGHHAAIEGDDPQSLFHGNDGLAYVVSGRASAGDVD